MADLKPPQPPTSWYVPVPKPGSVDSQTQKTMNAIQENLERLAGIRSGGDFSLITATDMVDQTYIEGLAGQPQSVVNADVDPGQNPWGVSPPAPTSLNRVTHSNDGIAAPWYHHLEWTNPEDLTNVYYIEVWSSTIDDVGTASRIAIVTPPQNSLMAYGILMSVDYYYWIRSISYGYKKSLWEPNPDTVGGYLVLGIDTVGETIDNLMDILAGETPPAYDATLTYQIGDRVSYTTGSPSTTRKYVCTAETLNNLPTDTDYWDRTGILMTGEVDGTATVAIDGNLVVDGTIIARHITVSTLSAIAADVGTITAGTLSSADWAAAAGMRLDLGNKWLKMGGSNVTAAGAAAGIFLGWDEVTTSAYKMFIGTTSGDFLKFDGTNLTMGGGVEIGTTGYLRTAGKTTYADTDAGIWIGYDTDKYKLNIGDATNFIKWSGTAVSISCASGSGLSMLAGADITLTGDDSNPGSIIFSGSGTNIELGLNAAGTTYNLLPTADTTCTFNIGSAAKRFALIDIQATTRSLIGADNDSYGSASCAARSDSTANRAGFIIDNTGFLVNGTSNWLVFTDQYWTESYPHWHFTPNLDSRVYLGHSSYCWLNIYGDAGVTACSDKKWKINVKSSPLGLDFINKLDFIEWRFDHSTGKTRKGKFHGMLAQDVLGTLEEMGYTNDDFAGVNVEPTEDGTGENWGLVYEQFIAPLGRAIQELDNKVEGIING